MVRYFSHGLNQNLRPKELKNFETIYKKLCMNCHRDNRFFFFLFFFDFTFLRYKFRLEQIPKLQSFLSKWLEVSVLLEGEVVHNCATDVFCATATESLITETPSLHLPTHAHSFPLVTVCHLVSCSSPVGGI